MFRTGLLSTIRSLVLYTQQQIFVLQVMLTEICSILMLLAESQHNLCDKYLLLCIQYWTPDDGQETGSQHVEFYSEINLRN